MLGKIFGILTVASVIFSLFSGNIGELSAAATDGAVSAVELSFTMLGGMCFWCGVAKVLEAVGFTRILERVLMPVLKLIYPDAVRKGVGMGDVAANISANFLGLGNAALPRGIAAVKNFCGCAGGVASDDMVTFVVLATTPFQLLPTTLAALRQAHGSSSPFDILLPVWICEIATTVFAIFVCRLFAVWGRIWRR